MCDSVCSTVPGAQQRSPLAVTNPWQLDRYSLSMYTRMSRRAGRQCARAAALLQMGLQAPHDGVPLLLRGRPHAQISYPPEGAAQVALVPHFVTAEVAQLAGLDREGVHCTAHAIITGLLGRLSCSQPCAAVGGDVG